MRPSYRIVRSQRPAASRCIVEGKDLRKAGLKVTLPTAQDSRDPRAQPDAAHVGRRDLQEAARLERGHRPRDRLSRADAIRGRGPGVAPSFRGWHGGVRDQPWHASRSYRVYGLRRGGGVRRSRRSRARQNAIAQRLGFRIEEHSLVLYGRCQRPDCPRASRAASAACRASRRRALRAARAATALRLSLRRWRGADRALAAASISSACARARAVISTPPSMRASSSTRSSPLKRRHAGARGCGRR